MVQTTAVGPGDSRKDNCGHSRSHTKRWCVYLTSSLSSSYHPKSQHKAEGVLYFTTGLLCVVWGLGGYYWD